LLWQGRLFRPQRVTHQSPVPNVSGCIANMILVLHRVTHSEVL